MRSMKPFNSRRSQRGYTLLEVLMSVGLGSLILASGATFMMERVDDVKDQSTAQYQTMFAQASERYVKNNFAALAASLAPNGAPTAISLPVIRAAGFAHSGLTGLNPYRQTPCLLVRRLTDSATGARLEALVATEGGIAIPDKRVPFVAAQSGAIGGFVPPTAPGTAQGAYGTWQTALAPYNVTSCSGTPVAANRLASGMFFDVSSIAGGVNQDDVLHRVVVAGRPDLNRMNTDLDMGGFSIANANNITATGMVRGGYVQATSEAGTYAQTTLRTWGLHSPGNMWIEPGNGSILTFVNELGNSNFTINNYAGRTQNMWGHSQFSRSVVSETLASTIGIAENTSSNGLEAGINFHNAGNTEGTLVLANTAARGGNRRLLAFDNSGASPGLGFQATGHIETYGGNFVTSNALYANIFYDYYNGGYYVQPRATTRLNTTAIDYQYTYGWIQSPIYYDINNTGYYVIPSGTSYMGDLNIWNAYVRSRGRWLSDVLPNWVHKGTFYVEQGWGVGKPTCYNGGTPKILVIPKNIDVPEEAYFGAGSHQATKHRTIAYDYGSYWGVEIGVYYYYGNGGSGFWPGSGLAMSYCWYP